MNEEDAKYARKLREQSINWARGPQYVNKLDPITIKLPPDLMQWLQDLVDRNVFPTRSEAIRFYLRVGKDSYPY